MYKVCVGSLMVARIGLKAVLRMSCDERGGKPMYPMIERQAYLVIYIYILKWCASIEPLYGPYSIYSCSLGLAFF